MTFERDELVRFAHRDPAGIVFSPRCAEPCDELALGDAGRGPLASFAEGGRA